MRSLQFLLGTVLTSLILVGCGGSSLDDAALSACQSAESALQIRQGDSLLIGTSSEVAAAAKESENSNFRNLALDMEEAQLEASATSANDMKPVTMIYIERFLSLCRDGGF